MKDFLDYLIKTISENTIMQYAANVELANNDLHMHEGWEIKFFTGTVVAVPPLYIHAGSRGENFLGSLLFSPAELQISFNKCIFQYHQRTKKSFQYEKLLEAYSILPEQEGSCKKELSNLFFRQLISDLTTAPENEQEYDLASTVRKFLTNNCYLSDFSISFMAEKIGYSQQYLNRKYKDAYGRTIQQDLLLTRLENARKLLKTGKYLVSETAKLTGWNNAFYFSSVYKKYFGESPSKTMQNIRTDV